MKKKIVSLLTATVMTLGVVGCGDTKSANTTESEAVTESTDTTENEAVVESTDTAESEDVVESTDTAEMKLSQKVVKQLLLNFLLQYSMDLERQ